MGWPVPLRNSSWGVGVDPPTRKYEWREVKTSDEAPPEAGVLCCRGLSWGVRTRLACSPRLPGAKASEPALMRREDRQ